MDEADIAAVDRLRNSPSPIIQIAEYAHSHQVDKAGRPYILHPMRVAHRVAVEGGSFHHVAAAWLHDTLEDTDLTSKDLREVVPEWTVHMVQTLTHRKYEPYTEYIARILTFPGAKAVKRADILDNLDPARLPVLDLETQHRLIRKYTKALAQLEG